jgi:serine O-acetyltransferase
VFLRTMTATILPSGASVGGGLHVSHVGAIVVSPATRLGRDCNLSQGSTIGVGGRGEHRGAPFIGDRVYVGPGAKIFGPIRVGDDVAVGANAVVREDVPDGAVVVGVPARVVSHRGSRDLVLRGRRLPPLARLLAALLRPLVPRPARLLLAA